MKIKFLLISCLLLVVLSCESPLSNLSTVYLKNPPLFSLFEIAPAYTNISDLSRFKRYDKILQSSPIPVFIINQHELPKELEKYQKNDIILCGLYVSKISNNEWPSEFIFINKNASPEQIMTTYFHEIQHYKCLRYGCHCSSNLIFKAEDELISNILKEKHAIANELKEGLSIKDVQLLENSIRQMTYYIVNNQECIYRMASLSVINGKEWKEVAIYLKQLRKNTTKFE